MELFGLASGSSQQGPSFPYLPECILKNYPVSLLQHPAMPSTNPLDVLPGHDDITGTPTVLLLPDAIKVIMSKSNIRLLGFGLAATVVAYGAWRIGKRWVSESPEKTKVQKATEKSRAFAQSPLKTNKTACLDDELKKESDVYRDLNFAARTHSRSTEPLVATEDNDFELAAAFQQHGDESMVRLMDVRCRLEQLEGQKEVLLAEIQLRKDMVEKLQGENNEEREKRQQAEFKMEMMQIENVQLHKLRKDLAFKQDQIERLEDKLKQKDQIHSRLLKEGCLREKDAVLKPNNAALKKYQAKDLETLQTRLERLESTLAQQREYKMAQECPLEQGDRGQVPIPVKLSSFRERNASRCAFHIERAHSPVDDLVHEWPRSRSPVLRTRQTKRSPTVPRKDASTMSNATDTCERSTSMARLRSEIVVCPGSEKHPKNKARTKPKSSHPPSSKSNDVSFGEPVGNLNECTNNHQDLDNATSKSCSITGASVMSESRESQKSSRSGVLAHLRAFFRSFQAEDSESFRDIMDDPVSVLDDMLIDRTRREPNSENMLNDITDLGSDQSVRPLSDDGVFLSASCGSLSSSDSSLDRRSSKASNSKRIPYKPLLPSKKASKSKHSSRRDKKDKHVTEKTTKETAFNKSSRDSDIRNISENNNELSVFTKQSPKAAQRSMHNQSPREKHGEQPQDANLSQMEGFCRESEVKKLSPLDDQAITNLSDKTDNESEQSWIVIKTSVE